MVRFIYDKFPTHVAKRKRKTMPDVLAKVNNNAIYGSNIVRYERNTVMNELHEYLISGMSGMNIPYDKFWILLKFCVPLNYGSVKMIKGKLNWKPVSDDYKGKWDAGNYGDIWNKAFEDALQLAGVIEGDDVSIVKGHGVEFEEVNSIDDRKLIFEIHKR